MSAARAERQSWRAGDHGSHPGNQAGFGPNQEWVESPNTSGE